MPKCLIKGCTTKRVRGQRMGDTIMHSFPGSPTRVRKWLASSGQHFDNLEELIDKIVATKKPSNYRICSQHFSPMCYEIIGSRKVLTESALPTICPQEQAPQRATALEPVPQTSSSDGERGSDLDKQVAQSKKDHNYAYIIKPFEMVPFVRGVPDDEQVAPQPIEAMPLPTTKTIFSQTTAVVTRNSTTQTSTLFVQRPAIKCRSSSTTTRGLIKCKDASTSTGSYEEFQSEIEKYQKIFSRMEELKRSYMEEKMESLQGTSTLSQGVGHGCRREPAETGVFPFHTKNIGNVHHKTDILYAAPEMSDVSNQSQELLDEEPSCNLEEKPLRENTSTNEKRHIMERKFLVFESCLDKLLMLVRCQHVAECPATMIRRKKYIRDTCLTVVGGCTNGHTTTLWQSQPYISGIPAGDVLSSAAILLSGNNYQKVKEYFRILGVPFMSAFTYALYQRKYCFPAIDHSWLNEKRAVRESLVGRPVCLTGDGHCDRSGFSAKYCTYTFMDEKSKKIVDVSVTRVSERTSSVAMERKAFRRTLNNILNDGIEVLYIATDRHPSIQKVMREEYSDMEHQFDVRHYTKTLNKKLCALARKRNNKALEPWVSPITRYFWFITEYCKGNVFLLKELWNSTVYHVSNCHSWANGKYTKKCLHADLSEEEVKERAWIQRHSNALSDLSLLVHDKRIQSDLYHLKECCQTDGIQVFHSTVLKYRPEGIHFKMDDMVARTKLAVLAHNFNVNGPQEAVKRVTDQTAPFGLQRHRPHSKMKEEGNIEKVHEVSGMDHIDLVLDQIIGLISGEIKHKAPW
uniref:THAP-type domain-containing protein n=1 Tax=Leptobrachium leishanense TaxID=445787 RepID=A0A8C5MFU6_9ANUR